MSTTPWTTYIVTDTTRSSQGSSPLHEHVQSHSAGKAASAPRTSRPRPPRRSQRRGRGGPGENVIAPAPVCLQTPATAMSQKFKPPGAFQLSGAGRAVPRRPQDPGLRGGDLRESRYEGTGTGRQQPPPGFSDLGLRGEVLGPRTRDAGGRAGKGSIARGPRGHWETRASRVPRSGGGAHKRVVTQPGKTSLEGWGSGPCGQFRGCREERAAGPSSRDLAPGREKP